MNDKNEIIDKGVSWFKSLPTPLKVIIPVGASGVLLLMFVMCCGVLGLIFSRSDQPKMSEERIRHRELVNDPDFIGQKQRQWKESWDSMSEEDKRQLQQMNEESRRRWDAEKAAKSQQVTKSSPAASSAPTRRFRDLTPEELRRNDEWQQRTIPEHEINARLSPGDRNLKRMQEAAEQYDRENPRIRFD